MQCYRHPERAAVGTCKYCQRGLCAECAGTVRDVLACKDLHESQVEDLLRMIHTSILQASRVGLGYIRNAVFYGLVGLVFAALGVSQLRFLGIQALVFIGVGLLLMYAAAANFLESRRFR